jgi:flagellar motor switch protein FliN/FliY
MGDEESLDDAWADALEEADPENPTDKEEAKDDNWDELAGNDSAASFDELGESGGGVTGSQNLDFLLDIPLKVSVELGRSSMIIDKMLQLTQGSVVELDKSAGETVDIYVNDKLLGKGEVIVVNERFGVRITEIISQADRIKNIG